MILVRETQGIELLGAIDGTNATFTTTQDMDVTFVNVYLNGLLLVLGALNGYNVTAPRTVTLLLVPTPGDTLEVEYRAPGGEVSGSTGGMSGGVPQIASLTDERPEVTSVSPLSPPDVDSEDIRPEASATTLRPSVLTQDIKPSIL